MANTYDLADASVPTHLEIECTDGVVLIGDYEWFQRRFQTIQLVELHERKDRLSSSLTMKTNHSMSVVTNVFRITSREPPERVDVPRGAKSKMWSYFKELKGGSRVISQFSDYIRDCVFQL